LSRPKEEDAPIQDILNIFAELKGGKPDDVSNSGAMNGNSEICINSASGGTLDYYTGVSRVSSDSTYGGGLVCGTIPVMYLQGTPIGVGSLTQQTGVPEFPTAIGMPIVFGILIVAMALMSAAMRKRLTESPI
jgi:hypothetical protein